MLTLYISKLLNSRQPPLREYDPTTIERIKEGAYLTKAISETQITARKCEFFAGICSDQEVADFFRKQADSLAKASHMLQQYFEGMTKE